MELSRKLEMCEQKRRSLQDQLYELERCWKPLSVLFELRELEAAKSNRSLQDCLEKKTAVDKQCAELVATMDKMCPPWKRLMKNKDVEKRNKSIAAMVESLQKNREKKRIDLQTMENKVKELSAMKKSLSMQLSGLRHRHRAERGEYSMSASAKGCRETK